jgi:hypothetical protein
VLGDVYASTALLTSGTLGVGTTTPGYPVDVEASSNGVSIFCTAKVLASEFSVYSDRRIKADIVAADTDAQLAVLQELSVCTFSYIDTVGKGAGSRVGFIAQEVERVLPTCVAPVSEYLPNVMATLPVVSTDGPRVTLDVSGLSADALAALAPAAGAGAGAGSGAGAGAGGVAVKCRLPAPLDAVVFGTLTLGSGATAVLDLHGSLALPPGQADVFLVGTQVHDFRTLNYEQMSAVTIGAIQAQQRRIEALEALVLARA